MKLPGKQKLQSWGGTIVISFVGISLILFILEMPWAQKMGAHAITKLYGV